MSRFRFSEGKRTKEKGKREDTMRGISASRICLFTFSFFLPTVAAGCQQKMATQPAPRPYDENALFANKQSARPLEAGVVHRNQATADDPLVTWLTPEGKKPRDVKPDASGSFDPKSVVPPVGAPEKPEYFVSEFPFRLTKADLERGQTLYNSNCALCHGAAGWGNGKIAERGFLRPPSYHQDPARKETDWSTLGTPSNGAPEHPGAGLPMGYSRGFYRWGVKIALRDVPVGYIYQVITLGYGGMGSHDVQLADPADRWRVIGYVRALQLSQQATAKDLPTGADDHHHDHAPEGKK